MKLLDVSKLRHSLFYTLYIVQPIDFSILNLIMNIIRIDMCTIFHRWTGGKIQLRFNHSP